MTGWFEELQRTARHPWRVSGTGRIFRTEQSLCQLRISFSSDPYKLSNSVFMATLNRLRATVLSGASLSHLYSSHKRLNSATGEFEGWDWNWGYWEKKLSSGVLIPRARTMVFSLLDYNISFSSWATRYMIIPKAMRTAGAVTRSKPNRKAKELYVP
jgi:hypothetical protein